MARSSGARVGLRSEGAAAADVVVLDTIGELASLYGLAELVFSGGSLVPIGGHNLLEPIRAERVVVHGPHLENQRSQRELLEPLGVLHPVLRSTDLAPTLEGLWNEGDRHRRARAAAAELSRHRGAARRNADLIWGALSGTGDA